MVHCLIKICMVQFCTVNLLLEVTQFGHTLFMPTKEKPKNTHHPQSDSDAWIATVFSTLNTHWADYIAAFPANQPIPDFNHWLALMHAAVTSPQELPHYLNQFLTFTQNGDAPPDPWQALTDALALTFEAAKHDDNNLTGSDWQNLLQIQNRILKAAAQSINNTQTIPDGALPQVELRAVSDLSYKIAAVSNPDELLHEAALYIQQAFGFEYVNIFLLNASQQVLTLQSAIWKNKRPDSKDLLKLQLNQGIVGQAAAAGKSRLVNDVSADPNFLPHPALPNVKAELSVPLRTAQHITGVLDIQSERLNAFSDSQFQLVQIVAGLLSTALTNARLQQVQQRYKKEQTLIYDSVVNLGTGMDMDTQLTSIGQKITDVIGAGACVICQIDETAQTVTALSEYVVNDAANPPGTWRKLNMAISVAQDPVSQQILKAARPIVSRAKSQQQLGWQRPANAGDNSLCWNVLLALPIEIKMRVAGIIEIYDTNRNRQFSAEDVQICRILATQTALAIEQTRLFDETLRRLNEVSMLYAMAQKISSSLDLNDILNTIVTSLREAVGCRACCIFLIDETGNQLEIKAADGLKPQWRQMAKLKLGQGAAGRAAAEGKTIYVPDTHNDPNFIFFDKDVHSLMVVPLMAHGHIIGAINVDDNRTAAFDSAQERLLTIAAAQAGAAIENARLFNRVAAEQQQLQAIMQHMADGLLLINSQGTIITCNSTVAMMLGISHNQITGKNTHAADLHPNLASITASTTHHARTGVLSKEVTIENPRPRTLQVFTTPVISDEGRQVGEVRLIHDVTKERELDQLKDDFFSTISHELRTPLFSIQGFAQLMLEEKDLDQDTQTEFLTTIQRQAGQLSEMVNNLLDISKLDEGKLVLERSPVSLLELIRQTTLKLQGFAHRQQINLVTALPAELPIVIGDAQRLEQVLTNLIGNAIKFSKEGDKVVITALAEEKQILVQVQDYGIGIPPDAVEQIFSRFYQAHGKHERSAMGSGLGLHIAKKIVDGHGGRIWAESESGEGSIFSFTLPVSG